MQQQAHGDARLGRSCEDRCPRRRSKSTSDPKVAKLRQDWRGAPQLHKLDVRRELRGQGLQHDLRDPLVLATHGIPIPFAPRNPQDKRSDVAVETITSVEFLGSAGDAFALGHSRGKVSFWRLAATSTKEKSPYDAWVLGSFRMCRKYDVLSLSAATASTQPREATETETAVAARGADLEEEVWLALSSGPVCVVVECSGAVSGPWVPPVCRAVLDHLPFLPRSDDEIFTVLLTRVGAVWRVLTVAEDGVLRVWELQKHRSKEACNEAVAATEDGWSQCLLWNLDIGDARQMRMSVLPAASPESRTLVAVARCDHLRLELLDLATGTKQGQAEQVWPQDAMPQTIVFDTLGFRALCSSLTSSGVAVSKVVAIGEHPLEDAARDGLAAAEGEADCPFSGVGRRLALALPVPAADVVIALVGLGGSHLLLEVWEGSDVFGGEERCGRACFRTRVPSTSVSSGLVAAGGCRLILLDPVALLTQGELRILEWSHLSPKLSPAEKAAEGGCRKSAAGGCLPLCNTCTSDGCSVQ
mmetsp:Transcript_10305/g.23233  ORF Transcript_10305/g.23233 Transcript_10305/m.23233 type:complete len:529 (-) Transcript_10305:85-1671(-)